MAFVYDSGPALSLLLLLTRGWPNFCVTNAVFGTSQPASRLILAANPTGPTNATFSSYQ